MAASGVVYGRGLHSVRELVQTVVVWASDLQRNPETASEREWSVDRQSRNQLTGNGILKRDGPRRQTRNRP
jgi:hypothetical protein